MGIRFIIGDPLVHHGPHPPSPPSSSWSYYHLPRSHLTLLHLLTHSPRRFAVPHRVSPAI
eukprot:3941538-Rhodomonas_salina.12